MPMKPKEDEMLSEILEVNPNKKKKKEKVVEDTPNLSSDWEVEEEETDEEL